LAAVLIQMVFTLFRRDSYIPYKHILRSPPTLIVERTSKEGLSCKENLQWQAILLAGILSVRWRPCRVRWINSLMIPGSSGRCDLAIAAWRWILMRHPITIS